MTVYAIGDVQGCYRALSALVDAIAFDPERDEVWLAGDLVNRGPDSASVLRWARDHSGAVRVVLGNHDLYLLGRALGAISRRRGDTLDELLAADDADELVRWLRAQPLLMRDGDWVMVHAALHPAWSIDEAALVARELEGLLQSDEAASLLTESHTVEVTQWSRADAPRARQLAALAVLTRLRCVSSSGALTFDYTGTLADLPEDRVPWWRAPHTRNPSLTVITGHWAALGHHREAGLLATDTGCAWGRHLTAVRLSDGAVTQAALDGTVSSSSR
ncbi:MAG: symmetrical bis(5'-nucleosyl)-tetraphosphatase [Myxococcota bacterium]